MGLILLAPLLLVTAATIRWTSPGPVFFTQKARWPGRKPFTIYKFRSMRVGADAEKAALRAQSEQDGPAFKLANDPARHAHREISPQKLHRRVAAVVERASR